MPERCASPLKPSCGSPDIALYIYFGGRKLPICWRCWREIAGSDLQWGVDSPDWALMEEADRVRAGIAKRAALNAFTELAKGISGRGRQIRRLEK